MKTEDIPKQPASMWIPESDPETLALLAKLGEEASELAQRCCRAVAQGLDALDPTDQRPNWLHIEEEMNDVSASIDDLVERRLMDRVQDEDAGVHRYG